VSRVTGGIQSGRRGSNPRHLAWENAAARRQNRHERPSLPSDSSVRSLVSSLLNHARSCTKFRGMMGVFWNVPNNPGRVLSHASKSNAERGARCLRRGRKRRANADESGCNGRSYTRPIAVAVRISGRASKVQRRRFSSDGLCRGQNGVALGKNQSDDSRSQDGKNAAARSQMPHERPVLPSDIHVRSPISSLINYTHFCTKFSGMASVFWNVPQNPEPERRSCHAWGKCRGTSRPETDRMRVRRTDRQRGARRNVGQRQDVRCRFVRQILSWTKRDST
jgi:hypothetical protein